MYQPSLFILEQYLVAFLYSELLLREMVMCDFIKRWRSVAIVASEATEYG
ncbi:MAG: hypothetical protein NVSMB27_34310 [Ktedonobacteraceae bacterium]